MAAFEFEFRGDGELTTWERVARQVAEAWLVAHPEVKVTKLDLAKTTQQLITELFKTGGRRQREALSAHAVSVLDGIGAIPEAFAPVRSFGKSADMPVAYGPMAAALAIALAPLAAAVQLARIPVTNAAVKLVDSGESIDRTQLRGFVVTHVRPHAQNVHARAGVGGSVDEYLRLILADVEALAAAVVESARIKNARPTRLNDDAAERTTHFVRTHLTALLGYATARFGQEADDIVGAALLKIAAQCRHKPKLRPGFAYGRTAVDNAAKDHFNKRQARQGRDVLDPELLERAAGTNDDGAAVDEVDVLLRMVLAAAARLANGELGSDARTARETLLRYFLVDPQQIDPRKARLAERALDLAATNEGGGIDAELGELAATLGSEGPAIEHITALAIAALRAQVCEHGQSESAGGDLAA